MTSKEKFLTVGKLRNFLENIAPETEITFGASKYRKRPLVFYRFKKRGEKLLQVELNEIDQNNEPMSEIDRRENVSSFLRQLSNIDDDVAIDFGSSLDAVPLEFRSITNVVAINLEQNEEPKWKVKDD